MGFIPSRLLASRVARQLDMTVFDALPSRRGRSVYAFVVPLLPLIHSSERDEVHLKLSESGKFPTRFEVIIGNPQVGQRRTSGVTDTSRLLGERTGNKNLVRTYACSTQYHQYKEKKCRSGRKSSSKDQAKEHLHLLVFSCDMLKQRHYDIGRIMLIFNPPMRSRIAQING